MRPSQGRLAARVGAGILFTRLLGFVRERVFAHYFGNGVEAEAFRAALRIPNVIRNLLGEGTISASFIPSYAGLLEAGRTEDARKLAGVLASLLVLVTAAAAVLGIGLAPVITDFVAPGFDAEKRDLTVTLVRILFPMSGLLILSGWCLGVLTSHRKMFLSFAAPAMWNIAQIATLVALGGRLVGIDLIVALAWGAVAGSVLQIGVQLPAVLPLVSPVAWGLNLNSPGVRTVVRAWLPVVLGAGVIQISSIVDTQLASLLNDGSVAVLGYGQLIAILPVSLFGVSVAAAALPELSRDATAESYGPLRERMTLSVRQVAFFVVPSGVALMALGPQLVGLVFETGAFTASDTARVGAVLRAYGVAVLAQGFVKLLASGHYSLGDTKTPLRVSLAAVLLSAVCAFALMQRYGAVGIVLGSGIGSTLNIVLNGRALGRRIGTFMPRSELRWTAGAAVAALISGAAAYGTTWLSTGQPVWQQALAGAGTFASTYAVLTLIMRHPEAWKVAHRLRRAS